MARLANQQALAQCPQVGLQYVPQHLAFLHRFLGSSSGSHD